MDKSLIPLINDIRSLLERARSLAYNQVNRLSVITNFETGRIIVDHEQRGNKRAQYGKVTLKIVSKELSGEFGRGYSVDNLELMRTFFLVYRERYMLASNQKSETLSRIFKSVVEFTLPEGKDHIFSREYKLYLPDKEELKKQLESTF